LEIRHESGHFNNAEGARLFYQSWAPSVNLKAVLVAVHGLAEHSGRYLNLVNEFVPRGYKVCSMDNRGHGHSEGRRSYINRFDDYVLDLDSYVDLIKSEHPNTKLLMIGHSLGGTIATAYAELHQVKLAGLILSAPALKAGSSITKKDKLLARIASRLLPTAGVASLDAKSISKDTTVVEAYLKDPLVYAGKISARLGFEIIQAIEKTIPPLMPEITVPTLIMQGDEDRLSDPEGSEILFQKISSMDKTLKRYPGLFHEIFNEPERALVFADMRKWIESHL
jgi:alpha-beta hydrolase superfamily lysophospholipase